jgi:hypothetical protein
MTNDGTQDPLPPPVLSDPLAGLVTGARYEPEALRVHVAGSAMPDISAVREAMASVLDEDSELDLGAIAPAEDFFSDTKDVPTTRAVAPVTEQPADTAPAEPPAEPPAEAPTAVQPAAPARPARPPRPPATRLPTPPTGIPAPRMPRDRKIKLPSRGPKLPPTVKGREHSSAGSVTLIIALLVVMGVLAIVFLASFVDSIASLFD